MYIIEHCIDHKEYFYVTQQLLFLQRFFQQFLFFSNVLYIRLFYKTLTIYVVYNNFIRVLPTKQKFVCRMFQFDTRLTYCILKVCIVSVLQVHQISVGVSHAAIYKRHYKCHQGLVDKSGCASISNHLSATASSVIVIVLLPASNDQIVYLSSFA